MKVAGWGWLTSQRFLIQNVTSVPEIIRLNRFWSAILKHTTGGLLNSVNVFRPSWISPPHEQLMCGFTSSYSPSNKTIQHVYSKWKKDTVLYIQSPVTPVKKLHQDAWLGTLMPSAECWSHVLGHHLDSHRWSVNEKAQLKTFTLNLAVKWNLTQ